MRKKSPRKKARRAVKIRRKRSSGRRLAERRCKFLWSSIIRAPGKCEKCGKWQSLQAAHILPKGMYRNMRFELDNGMCLCYYCHFHDWHKDVLATKDWFEKKWPGRYERLKLKAATAPKVDLAETEERLQAALD